MKLLKQNNIHPDIIDIIRHADFFFSSESFIVYEIIIKTIPNNKPQLVTIVTF